LRARIVIAGLTTGAVLFAVAKATLTRWDSPFLTWFPGFSSRMWLMLTWCFPPLIVLASRIVWPATRAFSLAAVVPVFLFLGLWHNFNVDLFLWMKRTVLAMGGSDTWVAAALWTVLGTGVFITSFVGTYFRVKREGEA
jgi:hypothetical protein